MARNKVTREFYIPVDAVKVERHGLTGAEVYTYDCNGPCAIFFIGKRAKPTNNYRYATVERREAAIDEFFNDREAVAKIKEDRKAADKARKEAAVKEAKVGDIYYTAWGYDQTNIDFYEIVEKKGVTFKIREIGKEVVREEEGADYVVADPHIKKGDVITKRINAAGGFTIHDFARATRWDGTPKYETAWGYGH